jgi:hypothetical protein
MPGIIPSVTRFANGTRIRRPEFDFPPKALFSDEAKPVGRGACQVDDPLGHTAQLWRPPKSAFPLALRGADSPKSHAIQEPIANDQRMEQHGGKVGEKC